MSERKTVYYHQSGLCFGGIPLADVSWQSLLSWARVGVVLVVGSESYDDKNIRDLHREWVDARKG